MSTLSLAKESLGPLLMIGFEGKQLSDETSAFFSQADIGGTILFSPNYENPEQLLELCSQIQGNRGKHPLCISVDQEGGRFQRFKEPFTRIPTALKIGQKDSPKLAFDLAQAVAKELACVGVNLNFSPVADINTNPKNPVIGDRSYGDNEEIVSKMVTAFVRGHLLENVQPCVKHFPGHGDTVVDSHFDLPKINTPLSTLRDREIKPFIKAFKSRCSMVMSAHIINPAIDPDFPGTLSQKTLRGFLRGELRYSRIIFSDDMEMKAISDHFGKDDAPSLALQAGCDILIYRSEAAGRHAYESLIRALEVGKLDPSIVIEAASRVNKHKSISMLAYQEPQWSQAKEIIGCPAHQELAAQF